MAGEGCRVPRPRSGLAFFALGLAIPLLVSNAGVTKSQAPAYRDRDFLRRTPVVKVAERIAPTVVAIEVERRGRLEQVPVGGFRGEGSGVLINSRGYALTNYHVIKSARAIRVTVREGGSYGAELVATSEESDLALLRVDGGGRIFPAVSLGSSRDLLMGETVVALGNPYGLEHTVSTGVVSATKRSVRLPNGAAYHDFIQTDAAINPGNSGGALVNLYGELIGINTAILNQGWGIAFAIPADRIKEILASYVFKEHYTGLTTEPSPAGLRVLEVRHASPAARAGIEPGDVLRSWDGNSLARSFDIVVACLGASTAEPLSVVVTRRDRLREVMLPAISLLWDRIGLRGDAAETRLPSGESVTGLRIDQVRASGPASSIDVRKNDFLYRVAVEFPGDRLREFSVSDERDLADLLEAYPENTWKVEVIREGLVFEGPITPKR